MTEIKEALESVKEILKSYTEDPEFIELQATLAKSLVDAYTSKGFSRAEALQIVCSSFQKIT